jgi:hypothetical protein
MFSFLALSKPTLGVVPVTNQFAWGVGMGCAQGSDVIGMRIGPLREGRNLPS